MTKRGKLTVRAAVAVAALGVVFGDLGTSPLYALQAIFSHGELKLTEADVFGIISLIFWAITIVVSIKYVAVLMRVDNHGEGGDMTLLSLLMKARLSKRAFGVIVLVGLVGISLFYGDGIITPAISLLSSVEGLKTIAPDYGWLVVPITVALTTMLFLLQRRGTAKVGAVFGPVMALWFVASAAVGIAQIVTHPGVLEALLPTTAIAFIVAHPPEAFVALGAVILAVTGAEALYADMGHFGRPAISRAWFLLVFPALTLCYLGQGALAVERPGDISHIYFAMYPDVLRGPAVLLATLATVIASQAVIAGVFSLTAQATRLGLAPRFLVRHTSESEEGQVYIGGVNWLMYVLVVALIIGFGSSVNLAGAFGLSVAGTLLIDTILFMLVLIVVKRVQAWKAFAACLVFLIVDSAFFASGLTKVPHGAWISLVVAGVALALLTTWTRGRKLVEIERKRVEGTLEDFVRRINHEKIPRVAGTSVYLSHHYEYAPLALVSTLERLHELPETVIIATVETAHEPHVPMEKRATLDNVLYANDGITRVRIRFGFDDTPNVPRVLDHMKQNGEFRFDADTVSYFVSSSHVELTRRHWLSSWRKRLYSLMERNSTSPTDYFHLPTDRTLDMAAHLEL